MKNNFVWITGHEQKKYLPQISHLRKSLWPQYQLMDERIFLSLYTNFPQYQWLVLYKNDITAYINAIPVFFHQSLDTLPQQGINWLLKHLQTPLPEKPNYLAAVSANVNPKYQGHGISALLLERMKSTCLSAKFKALIVPVRPCQKEYYPLISMEDYLTWKRKDDASFDPWCRVHENLGGTRLHVCKQSRTIKAPVDTWSKWLNLPLLQSGHYLIKGGLNPLYIDVEKNTGTYIEPNVWFVHQ